MWALSLALAADRPPVAARLCAEAVEGTEVEVCLKLAVTHPDEADEVAAALRSHIDRRSSPDRELMFGLLLLMDDVSGVRGTEALAALDDPRAIAPLVHAVETREGPVALAAVDALATYADAVPHLARWMLDPERPLEVQVRSAQALGRSGREEAADAIIDSLRRRGLHRDLRAAMVIAIETHHPDRTDELVHQISRDGTTWLTLSGGASVGYAMAYAGRFSQPEIAAIGGMAGMLAGGTVGYLVGQALPTEAGDAAFITTNGLVGTAAGITIGAGAWRGRPDVAGLSGLVGEAGGLGLGLLLHRAHRGEPIDSVEAAVLGVATAGVIGGALDIGVRNGLSDPEGQGTNPPLMGIGIGLLAGTALGHVVAPEVRFEGNDWALIGLSTGVGAGIGAFAPLAGNERGALPAVGAAAGALAGFTLAGTIDPGWDALASGTLGAAYGGLIVSGTALWITDDPQLAGAGALAGGVLGMGLGGILADLDQDPIDDRDVAMMVYATGWSAALTVGAVELRGGRPFRDPGPLLVVPAATGALVGAFVPMIDVPVTHSSAAFSLGLVGGYLGGTAGELIGQRPIEGALIGGNAGLLVGTVLLSPWVGTPPTTVGLADAGGILGGAGGVFIARAIDDESDSLLLGGMVGAGIGFAGGAFVGHALRRSGATRNIALHLPRTDAEVALLPGPVMGRDSAAWGATLEIHGW